MVTAPAILGTRHTAEALELELRVPENLLYFRGHFPGFPLLPGVVQVDWAIALARQHFALPPNFRRLSALKFQQVITPGMRLKLLLSFKPDAGEISFRYDRNGADCSSGRVLFGN